MIEVVDVHCQQLVKGEREKERLENINNNLKEIIQSDDKV